MISISQNLKFEATNLITNIFIEEIGCSTKNCIEDLLYSFHHNRNILFMLNFQAKIHQAFLNALSKSISFLDRMFLNSNERKKKYYKNKENISRYKVTIFGELNYSRNYYTDKDKQNGFFFIDELFGFEKYKNYDEVVRGLLIDEAVRSNANNTVNNSLIYNFNILDYLSGNKINKIPRQTLYYWLNNWKLPIVDYDTIEHDENLYVMVDEKWIHEQKRKKDLTDDEKSKKHFIMSKCFVAFTGAKTKHGRTKLKGKHTVITSSKQPWKEFMEQIYKIYDFSKIKTIYLLSDSGSWILANKDEMKLYTNNRIIVCTCEFHVVQKIHRITTDLELRQQLIESIYDNNDKNKFIELVDKYIDEHLKRKEKLTEYKNYILNHWKSIQNMKSSPIKSSMESHISHCVAEHFGSRPKGYSENNIEQYLKLQELKINGINILDLFLKSVNDTDYSYNEKELDFSMFDQSNSFLPINVSSNPISSLLHDVAYNNTY
jgi:hypothetical protein